MGRQALARARPKPEEVVLILMVGSDGVTKEAMGYVPTSRMPWFVLLLDAYRKSLPSLSPLGGPFIHWDDAEDAADWATRLLLYKLRPWEAKSIIDDFLEMELFSTKFFSRVDDLTEEDVSEWMHDHYREISEEFEKKLVAVFDKGSVKQLVLSPIRAYSTDIKTKATVVIDLAEWQ